MNKNQKNTIFIVKKTYNNNNNNVKQNPTCKTIKPKLVKI